MSTAASAAIQGMNKDELVAGYQRLKTYVTKAKEKIEAPMAQGALTVSGWGGGIMSGVIQVYLPEVFGFPVDATLGVGISLLSLLGAGQNKMWDAAAVFGVGLAAPAISRGTVSMIRQMTEAPAK